MPTWRSPRGQARGMVAPEAGQRGISDSGVRRLRWPGLLSLSDTPDKEYTCEIAAGRAPSRQRSSPA